MSNQSSIDAINDIFEKIIQSNVMNLQIEPPQTTQTAQESCVHIRDPHDILKTLNLMRSRL